MCVQGDAPATTLAGRAAASRAAQQHDLRGQGRAQQPRQRPCNHVCVSELLRLAVATVAADVRTRVATRVARRAMDTAVFVTAGAKEGTGTGIMAVARRLAVGDRVVLSDDHTKCSDAASGPLEPGEVGRIVCDDRSTKPFKIDEDPELPSVEGVCHEGRFDRFWWYEAKALRLATAAGATH